MLIRVYPGAQTFDVGSDVGVSSSINAVIICGWWNGTLPLWLYLVVIKLQETSFVMSWKVIRKTTCALVTECDSLGSNGSPKCMFVTRLLSKYSMMVKCTTQKSD